MPSFVTYSDEQEEWGYLVETTWGTANADNAAFKKIKFPKGTKVETPLQLTNLQLDRSARQYVNGDYHVDNYSDGITITVPELLLTLTQAADLLYACLQNKVSEGLVGTGYQKVFKFHLTQPDFTANAGYFFTLAWKGPVASKHVKFTSCIVKSMELSFDKSGRGDQNIVKVRNLVIRGKKHALGINFTGAWVDPSTTRYNAHAFTYKHADSTAMEWLKYSIKLDNGAEAQDKDSDGTPKTFFLNWPETAGTVEVLHWYNANTTGTIADLHSIANAGTATQFSIVSATADSTTGHLKLVWYGTQNQIPHGNDNRQITTPVSMVIGHASTSTNDALIVTIADAVDQTP